MNGAGCAAFVGFVAEPPEAAAATDAGPLCDACAESTCWAGGVNVCCSCSVGSSDVAAGVVSAGVDVVSVGVELDSVDVVEVVSVRSSQSSRSSPSSRSSRSSRSSPSSRSSRSSPSCRSSPSVSTRSCSGLRSRHPGFRARRSPGRDRAADLLCTASGRSHVHTRPGPEARAACRSSRRTPRLSRARTPRSSRRSSATSSSSSSPFAASGEPNNPSGLTLLTP